jgi:hypothetical protein
MKKFTVNIIGVENDTKTSDLPSLIGNWLARQAHLSEQMFELREAYLRSDNKIATDELMPFLLELLHLFPNQSELMQILTDYLFQTHSPRYSFENKLELLEKCYQSNYQLNPENLEYAQDWAHYLYAVMDKNAEARQIAEETIRMAEEKIRQLKELIREIDEE